MKKATLDDIPLSELRKSKAMQDKASEQRKAEVAIAKLIAEFPEADALLQAKYGAKPKSKEA